MKILREQLSKPCHMIDWSAAPVNGKRPEIHSRPGTRIRVLVRTSQYGRSYTAYVKRYGRVWSNTKMHDGRTWFDLQMDGHEAVSKL